VVPGSRLTVLCAGRINEDTPHLLTVSAVQKVVTSLHSHFDWIIVDGPAVTTNPDASSLAAMADGAILVVKAQQTRWEVAEEAKKILDQSGVNLLGGVLNGRKYHIPDFIYRRL
jgi:Mrp family chromosome partitioning ATPase